MWMLANWRVTMELVGAGLITVLFVLYMLAGNNVRRLEKDLALEAAQKEIVEIQKAALIAGIEEQNKKVEELGTIAIQKKAVYEAHLKKVQDKYEAESEEAKNLGKDEECEFIKRKIDETVIELTANPSN